jgi:hypothetical protein
MESTDPLPSPPRSTREIAAEITDLAANLNAANHRLLMLIAEFDRRSGWSEDGAKSCAHWLNWQCGLNLGAAREKVRVAHALEELPKVSAAMERGELSYAKVRAITRVADEGTEDQFLQMALSSTAHHVERLASQFRNVMESAELGREQQQHAQRAVHYWWEPDGSLSLRARLPAEAGALVLRALEHIVEEMPPPASPTDPGSSPSSWSQRRADALAVISESYLAHGAEALAGGDRHQVIVHVDAETLCTHSSGRCEIDEGPSIAAETARRLACDGSIVAIMEDDRGEPLDVGRKTRAIPPAMRRALAARDKGCRFPGCTHTRFVDGHHVRHWADGGETKSRIS